MIVNVNINIANKAATVFLYFGNQINIPAAICKTPIPDQIVGGILSIIEQGGSKKLRNLSAPIIKKEKLTKAVRILRIIKGVFLPRYESMLRY